MVFCRTSGFDWDEIYNWNVDEFRENYHALQRNDARSALRQFSINGQAFGGDKKSVKEFVEGISQWLPKEERNGGKGSKEDYMKAMQSNRTKLKG